MILVPLTGLVQWLRRIFTWHREHYRIRSQLFKHVYASCGPESPKIMGMIWTVLKEIFWGANYPSCSTTSGESSMTACSLQLCRQYITRSPSSQVQHCPFVLDSFMSVEGSEKKISWDFRHQNDIPILLWEVLRQNEIAKFRSSICTDPPERR